MSAPASTTAQASNTNPPTASTNTGSELPLPSSSTLLQAAKIALEQDREIKLDYFHESASGKAFLGIDPETNEKILVKSKDEFTSLISKLYKTGDEIIVLTENSIYIASAKILKRKVNLASLHAAYDS